MKLVVFHAHANDFPSVDVHPRREVRVQKLRGRRELCFRISDPEKGAFVGVECGWLGEVYGWHVDVVEETYGYCGDSLASRWDGWMAREDLHRTDSASEDLTLASMTSEVNGLKVTIRNMTVE